MTRNLYIVPNPDGSDIDNTTGLPVPYVNIKIERAPDVAGAPGAWAQIVSMSIDLSEENSEYLDSGGVLTSWYRHRFTTAGDAISSDYSPQMQLGDYIPRQWCRSDIPDTDITLAHWDEWRDQVLQDLSNEGLGRPAAIQSFTPSSYTDEWVEINAEIRRVVAVEKYDSAGYYLSAFRNFSQRGRSLRIFRPDPYSTYKIYGTAELRGFNDIDDHLFTIVKWGMRMYYMNFRRDQRIDMRPFLSRTKLSDTTTHADFGALFRDAEQQFRSRIEKAKEHVGYSGGARG